jgi:hypothetical protein
MESVALPSKRLLSEDRQTPHETSLVRAEIGSGMQRTTVVPQQ